ncbi:MAG: hypothetical protein WB562_18240 [Candidatus Sulfotelmatobacter sp.]
MMIGELKQLLAPLDDEMHIIVIGPAFDAAGDEIEACYGLREVKVEMEPDTAEEFARFGCDPIDAP